MIMDYEQKYKDALERARELYDKWIDEDGKDVALMIFPELKVSEDEKIVKSLKNCFEWLRDDARWTDVYGSSFESIFAWLKKQGKNNMGISEATKKKLEDNLNKALEKETPESWNEFLEKQGEQKPTWSEKDNQYLCGLIGLIEQSKAELPITLKGKAADNCINWLKSLRPQNRWKPSDEQMNALNDVISSRDIKYDVLSELWMDLNKLKG